MTIGNLIRSATLGAVLIAGGATGFHFYFNHESTFAQSAKTQDAETPISRDKLRHVIGLSDAFKEITRTVSPSVVNIRSTQHMNATETPDRGELRGQIPDDMLRKFFGEPEGQDGASPMPGNPRMNPRSPRAPQERMGEGSGVIVREDGYIITNNHVVDGADELTVKLNDDREFTGTVLGTDPDTDLAVIKIEASNLTPAKFGDSDTLEPGEWVLAMGSPFGLEHTVTAGIVSAKGRQIGIIRDAKGYSGFEDFIQTDAAINPGNSGGALVNVYGELVGINTAINSPNGGNIGIGFAIPSKMVRFVMDSIIDDGKVQRGYLGVGIQPLTRDLAETYGLSNTEGAVVNEVRKDSPAAKAGIEVDDIIVKFNGQPVTSSSQLMNYVAATTPDSKATVEVFRDGKHMDFTVKLAERNPTAVARNTAGEGEQTTEDLGLTVKPLTEDAARQLNAEDVTGVLVTKVDPDSPAGRLGLEPGDVITKIGSKSISSVDDFTAAMKEQNIDKGVRLHVVRDGTTRVIVMKSAGRK